MFPDVPFFLALVPSNPYSLWIRTLWDARSGAEATSDMMRATQLISTLAALQPHSAISVCCITAWSALEQQGAAGETSPERPHGWSEEKGNLK